MGDKVSYTDTDSYGWGKTECPYCGTLTKCYAEHRCSTEKPAETKTPNVGDYWDKGRVVVGAVRFNRGKRKESDV